MIMTDAHFFLFLHSFLTHTCLLGELDGVRDNLFFLCNAVLGW